MVANGSLYPSRHCERAWVQKYSFDARSKENYAMR